MEQLIPAWIIQQYKQHNQQGTFDAATMFVDLSGFTPLTEALLKHEIKGSETLADLMSIIFTPLVDTIYEYGGSITGFSGDAFTALFVGDAATSMPIATSAALIMAERFSEVARLDTPVGNMHFAFKIGLGFGKVIWNIVTAQDSPESRATYFYGGPGIEQSVEAQEHAQPGQIVLSQACLALFDQPPKFDVLDEQFVEVKSFVPAAQPKPSSPNQAISIKDMQPLVDPAVWQLTTRGEFRYVTTVLINLQAAADDPQLRHGIQQLFQFQNQYGGHLNSITFDDKGCTILMFWGAPLSMEHDALHASRFVSDLHEECVLPLRVGITSQWVYAGLIGTAQRSEYSCYGRGINLAARMMIQAAWDEVWLDQATAKFVQPFFQLEAHGAQRFKGFDQPIETWLLQSPKQVLNIIYRGKMVSRDTEMQLLYDYIQPLHIGLFAGTVLVIGEAGLGKSRLVHEFQQQTEREGPPIRWLLAQTDEIVQQSLNPWRSLVQQYFEQVPDGEEPRNKLEFEHIFNQLVHDTSDQELRNELRRIRSFLGALAGLYWPNSLYERIEPHLRLQNLFAAVKALIRAESLHQPILIQLEDAHWLDEDSLSLLRELTRNVINVPFGLIITTRPTDFVEQLKPLTDEMKTISLEPITADQARLLASNLLEAPISAELAQFLVGRSEGNPFFIEQLTLFLREQDLLTQTAPVQLTSEQAATAILPANVQNVLVARIDRLSSDVRRVVQTAAVLGREWPLRVLLYMLQEDSQLLDKINTAEAAEIWAALNELRYLFKHALLRDAAYTMQLRSKIRELHLAAAHAVERVYQTDLKPHYGDLVHHYRLAEQPEQERIWAYKAGEDAMERYANEEAVRYLSRALELTPVDQPQIALNILLTRQSVYDILGDRDKQLADINQALQLAGDAVVPETQVQLLYIQAQYEYRVGDYAAILPYTHQALALIAVHPEIDPELHIKLLHLHAITESRIADPEKAQAYMEQALSIARQINNRRWEALSLFVSASLSFRSTVYFQGQPRQIESLHKAAEIYQELDDPFGLAEIYNQFGVLYDEQGDYLQAIEAFKRSQKAYQEIGLIWRESASYNNLGLAFTFLGDYNQAHDYYERALDLAYESGNRHGICIILINLGLLSHTIGQHQTGVQYSQAALSMAQETGDKMLQGYAATYLGHCLCAQGRWQEAEKSYLEALQIRREMQHKVLEYETCAGLARLELGRSRLHTALTWVDPILTHLAENGSLDGAEEPFRVWWTCIQILSYVEDSRYAALVERAYAQLQQRAKRILDDSLRSQFLERIAVHRAIHEVWQLLHA